MDDRQLIVTLIGRSQLTIYWDALDQMNNFPRCDGRESGRLHNPKGHLIWRDAIQGKSIQQDLTLQSTFLLHKIFVKLRQLRL